MVLGCDSWLWILIIGLMDLWIVLDDVELMIGSVVDFVPMSGPPRRRARTPAGGEGKALSLTSTTLEGSVPQNTPISGHSVEGGGPPGRVRGTDARLFVRCSKRSSPGLI